MRSWTSPRRATTIAAMIDHIIVGVSDVNAAKKFYASALQPLGYTLAHEGDWGGGFANPLGQPVFLSLIHISEPTRLGMISYAVFCLKKKKKKHNRQSHTTKIQTKQKQTLNKQKS